MALEWGLVNRVVAAGQLEALTLELAGEMAANAPLSQRANKRAITALLHAGGELAPAVAQQLRAERRAALGSQDLLEGLRAFAEGRSAKWRGS